MTSEKTYGAEARLGSLWNHMGPILGGGNGQRQTIRLALDQTISSTTPAIVGSSAGNVPFSFPVAFTGGSGDIQARALLTCQQGTVASNQLFRFNGPVASHARSTWKSYPFAAAPNIGTGQITDISASTFGSGSYGNGTVFVIECDLIATFTSTGTLSLVAAEGTNLDTFVVSSYSWITFETVGQTT